MEKRRLACLHAPDSRVKCVVSSLSSLSTAPALRLCALRDLAFRVGMGRAVRAEVSQASSELSFAKLHCCQNIVLGEPLLPACLPRLYLEGLSACCDRATTIPAASIRACRSGSVCFFPRTSVGSASGRGTHISGSGSRVACGVRGLASTQPSSQVTPTVLEPSTTGPSLATSNAWACSVSTSHRTTRPKLNSFSWRRAHNTVVLVVCLVFNSLLSHLYTYIHQAHSQPRPAARRPVAAPDSITPLLAS